MNNEKKGTFTPVGTVYRYDPPPPPDGGGAKAMLILFIICLFIGACSGAR